MRLLGSPRGSRAAILAFVLCAPLFGQRVFEVRDIGPGALGNNQRSFACLDDVLFFEASGGASGIEPWRSDGTAAGTFQLADIHPSGNSSPSEWTAFDGAMYFVAFDPTRGAELWKSDGTSGGTALVVDLMNGFNGGPYALEGSGGALFFAGYKSGSGFELWKSDGTAQGTLQVAEIFAGATGSVPDHLTDRAGTLFFSARDDGTGERNLWRSDGTAGGTQMVMNFPGLGAPQDLFSIDLIGHGATLFFSAQTPSSGRELWASDGTTAGTYLVKDINPGNASSHPSELVAFDGRLYFTAFDPSGGRELWTSDGTAAGTQRVADIYPGAQSSEPNGLVAARDQLFFAAVEPSSGQELWASDGTTLGTRRVRDIQPGAASGLGAGFFFSYVTSGFDVVHFAADDGTSGTELWRSDGREGGTLAVADVEPGAGGALDHLLPYGMAPCGPWLFFLADDGQSGLELWASDWIFGDDFEAGDLAAWSAVVDPGGKLVVEAGAALEGLLGLAARLDGHLEPRYVEDESPDGGARYRARFRLDASAARVRGGAVLPGGAHAQAPLRTRVFAALDEGPSPLVAAIELELVAGGAQLIARARDGADLRETAPIALSTGAQTIEIDWQRASAAGALDGRLELFVGGNSVATLEGLDNETQAIELARLGVLATWPGVRGALHLDAFESQRERPIGR